MRFLNKLCNKKHLNFVAPLTSKLIPVLNITATKSKIISLGDKLDTEEHYYDSISLNKGDHRIWQVN